MSNNKRLCILLLGIILLLPIKVNATKGIIKVNVDSVLNVRNGINNNSTIIGGLRLNEEVTIINQNVGSNDMCNKWYQINFNGNSAYACGEYITIIDTSEVDCSKTTDEYEKSLCELGFPNSYIPHLKRLHTLYPSFIFKPVKIGLDFNTVVANQSTLGKSLIYYTFAEGYRSVESGSYSYETDTFNRHPTETNWWYANDKTIAYYLDPRNFLNENYIFMFEHLAFESAYQNRFVIENIMKNTFMPKLYSDFISSISTTEDETNQFVISKIEDDDLSLLKTEELTVISKDYVQAFLKAATKYSISPIHLTSRIIQEVGSDGSTSSSGQEFTFNGTTYRNLFNFYNIGAYGSTNPALNGLVWANGTTSGTATSYFRPWNTPYKSIVGGAEFLSTGYINVGQDTPYFQKWDVSPTSNTIYTHQYMQNISAPASESVKTYNAYKSIPGLLDQALVFSIPIYNNMAVDNYQLPNSGNPNNYLKEIKIDGVDLEHFSNTSYNYEVTVPLLTSSIKIEATPINSKTKISGTGTIETKEDKTISLIVTAENGTTRVFNLQIKKEDTENVVDLKELVNNLGVKYNENYFFGISIGTNVKTLIDKVKEYSNQVLVSIRDVNNIVKTDKSLATGDIVTLNNGKEEVFYEVIIKADVNGDGEITILDLLRIQKELLKVSNLSGSYLKSADINDDNKITILDLLTVQKHLLGVTKIGE